MSVIVRLQNLPWAANAVDIRQYFHGLSIPEGGVHIVGGELGDAFIAFSTDEDARQAMLRDGGKVKEVAIKLYLSSRAEMQKIIDQARQQSLGMQQFMSMPTMAPISVPVTNITGPNMSVPIPSVPNVPAMQVPLQNVAAMVTNLGKPDPSAVNRSVASVGIPDQADNKTGISSNVSVKSDTDKDKKDKRRRRTRSHSRGSSDSRSDSRSRSRSRSSSRSRDRKGRDRHYDRRRKRSRSRDRRRRRERSRSRERSYRDRRKDYNRHGSREEFDDNSQSSRWSNPAQRNRLNKPRPDFYNRDSQNQNRSHLPQKPNASKIGSNTDSQRPMFGNETTNSTDNLNDPKGPLLPEKKDNNTSKPSSSEPALGSTLVESSASKNANNMNSQNQAPNQNYYGNLPPPPMFNPQNLVSYPSYSPGGMPPFNTFPPVSRQMNQQDTSRKQEIDEKSHFGVDSTNSPLIHSGSESMSNSQNKMNLMKERESKSRFGNEAPSKDIPLPKNEKEQFGGTRSKWGYNDSNYPYSNQETKTDPKLGEKFTSGWGSGPSNSPGNKNNESFTKKVMNTCVQIKNVPDHTKHDDIRTFFRNAGIGQNCLKIVGDNHGRINGVYVKFDSIGDKKKAICRSGCLLNNSIVTVLHVDDKEFNNANDISELNTTPYWNSGNEEMSTGNINEDCDMLRKGNTNIMDCIKIQGSLRHHPLFNAKNKVHPHIRILVDKFSPVDVCIVKPRGTNTVEALMKFDSSMHASSAAESLGTVKIENKPVAVCTCSNDEFLQAKDCSIPFDVQNFIRTAKSQGSNFGKPNIKQEDRVDPRLQSSSYSDRRTQPDPMEEDDDFDSDVEMKSNDDEPEPEFKRSNKVLLPTPAPMLQMPLLNDNLGSNCILIQNLPLDANDQDILEFFSDIGIVPTQIHVMLDSAGEPYGDAFCEFERDDEAVSASSKDNFQMGKNNIHIRVVSRQEMSNALGLSVMNSDPNSFGGPPQGGPFYNGPPGPPMFGNNIMDAPRLGGGNDWVPLFNPGGGPMGPNPNNFNNMGSQGDRSFRGGRGGHRGRPDGDYRGGRGGNMDRGGRGRGEMSGRGGRGGIGRGAMRGHYDGPNRGGRGGMDGMGRGGRGGGDISRGGRGGGDSNRGGRGGFDSIRGGRGASDSSRGSRGGGDGSRGGRGGGDGSRGGRGGGDIGRGGRGGGDGSRGGRGGVDIGRGGRGGSDGSRGGRGGGDGSRGGRGGGDGSRGRGRGSMRGGSLHGGRDMNDYSRNQPPDLMSLPSAPPSIDHNQGGCPPLMQTATSITRPIQLEEDSVREFGQLGCVVSAENVPYRAELNDILEFFADFEVSAESIIRRYNDVGQVTGDARIAFKTPADAKRAIKYLNKKSIGNRKVTLSLFK